MAVIEAKMDRNPFQDHIQPVIYKGKLRYLWYIGKHMEIKKASYIRENENRCLFVFITVTFKALL